MESDYLVDEWVREIKRIFCGFLLICNPVMNKTLFGYLVRHNVSAVAFCVWSKHGVKYLGIFLGPQ